MRPADGALYATGSAGVLYRLDPGNGVATPVSQTPGFGVRGADIDKKGVVRHILQDVNPRAHVDEVQLGIKRVGERADQQLEVRVAEVRSAPLPAQVEGVGHATSLVTAAGRAGGANRLAP